jgi:hypothetical protein
MAVLLFPPAPAPAPNAELRPPAAVLPLPDATSPDPSWAVTPLTAPVPVPPEADCAKAGPANAPASRQAAHIRSRETARHLMGRSTVEISPSAARLICDWSIMRTHLEYFIYRLIMQASPFDTRTQHFSGRIPNARPCYEGR